jgi:hypothetical protein
VAKLTDQALLATIARKATDRDIRCAAVAKLTDQALLAKIAREEEWAVCRVAVETLTDQALLATIAREATDRDIRCAAVAKLTDQALLATIAREDKERAVRRVAVETLTDQALLATIAREAEDSHIRHIAETRTDQALLTKLRIDKTPLYARVIEIVISVIMLSGFIFAAGWGIIETFEWLTSWNERRVQEVGTRTFQEAGTKATDDFFSLYATYFNEKPAYRFKCAYDATNKTLSFSGDFYSGSSSSDLGKQAEWQADNVLPEIIQSIAPRVKELQAIELSNSVTDSFRQTAVWKTRLPLSKLSPADLGSKDEIKQYVNAYLGKLEDTASGKQMVYRKPGAPYRP